MEIKFNEQRGLCLGGESTEVLNEKCVCVSEMSAYACDC